MPISGRTLSGERRTATRAFAGTRRTYANSGGGGNSGSNPAVTETVYGPGVGGIALANTTLGGPNGTALVQSIMGFRASTTGYIASIRWYFLSADSPPGYGGGTGGTWTLGLYAADASGNPTGSAIATQAMSANASGSAGRLDTLGASWTVTAGQRYVLSWLLTDASPAVNYFATDYWWQPSSSPAWDGARRFGPRWADADLWHKYKENSTWVTRTGFLPIIDIAYDTGAHQGMSYGEAVYGSQSYHGKVNGANEMVRARWTQGSTITVTGAYWRVSKVSGTTDPLVISLRDSSDVLIDSVSVAASAVPTSAAPDSGSSNVTLGSERGWVGGSFASPVTLTSGQSYRLRLASAGGTYWCDLIRHLTAYGYHRSLSWADDGASERTTDGSSWATFSHYAGQADFQFALVTT